MKVFGLGLISTCLALTVAVLAQTVPPVVVAPIVPTAKARQVGFFAPINPDCSTTGDTEARIVKQPEHGDVEFEQGTGFTNYKPDNQRYACNTKAVQGTRVKYTSKEGYVGKDTFEVEFLTAQGADIVWKYSVTVK